ncbi:MAG TPA: IS1634 family transposase, partial [Candidatus Acetothermia bacterium]|nr:IS1634 family transposase [Candidatus Acetothermia bacterium]
MFIREKRRVNKDGSTVTYLQLVENRRVEGKVRQRVLCTLGRTDDPTLPRRLSALVETASRYAEVERLVLSRGVRVRTGTWGPHLVWRKVWGETVGPVVEEVLGEGKVSQAVYLMVLHRLSDPGSKVACFRFAQDVY